MGCQIIRPIILLISTLLYLALGDSVSCQFQFYPGNIFYDFDLKITLSMCLKSECRFRINSTVCFHTRCYEFRLYSVTPEFLSATYYAFTPPAVEQKRRYDSIQGFLARNLQQHAVSPWRLPYELWLMVAWCLSERECALLLAQEQVREFNKLERFRP